MQNWRVMTVQEINELTNIKVTKIRRLIRKGILPRADIPDIGPHVFEEDVLALMRKAKATSVHSVQNVHSDN